MDERTTYIGVRLPNWQKAILERLSAQQGNSGLSAALRRIITEWDKAQRDKAEKDAA